jgi:hypothetical protein
MNVKRTITVIASLVLAFAMVAGTWQRANATPEEGVVNDTGSGNMGIFIPGATDTSNIFAHKLSKGEVGWVPGDLLGKAILLEARDANGNTIGNPNLRTYVYFILKGADVRAWNRGELKIISRSLSGRTWQTCNSFAIGVSDQQVGQQTDQLSRPRLTCLTSQYNTIYALVRTESEDTGTTAGSQQQLALAEQAVIPQTGGEQQTGQQSGQQQTGQTGQTNQQTGEEQQTGQQSGQQQTGQTGQTNQQTGEEQAAAGIDFGAGNQGVFVPAATSASMIDIQKLDNRQAGWVPGTMVGRAILLRALDANGQVIDNPNLRTYVYFNLSNHDLEDWNGGMLRIMYRPEASNREWQTCSSFLVDDTNQQTGVQQTAQDLSEQQSAPRLACLTSTYNAIYALVRTEFELTSSDLNQGSQQGVQQGTE